MVDSKGIPTGPSARRRGPLIAVILVVIVVIIGVLGYQSIADARLEDRISKVETSLESIGISL
jgi:Tfp pilus assembly protein PilX